MLNKERAKLMTINHRVGLMIENALIDGVKQLLNMDILRIWYPCRAWAKEIIDYLEGNTSLEEA